MRKIIIAAAAAALLGGVSAASAAEVTGTVSAVDASAHTITLDSGQTFALANVPAASGADKQSGPEASFKAGDKVKIVYDELNGTLTATQITPVM